MKLTKIPDEYITTKAREAAYNDGHLWNQEAVDRVRRFAKGFCTIRDRNCQPYEFLPWFEKDVLSPLYGLAHKDTGLRLTKRGSVWTPRKQTKTLSIAVLSLYQLTEEPAGQIFICSAVKDGAAKIYKAAREMIEDNKHLSRRFIVRRTAGQIEDRKTGSILQLLSGKPEGKNGGGPTATFWDEISEIKDPEAWNRMYYAGKLRRQPVWLCISTPAYQRFGLAGEEYLKAQNILSGKDTDYEYLGVIRGVPAFNKDGLPIDWREPENWWDHLPALGITDTKEAILAEWKAAQGNPRQLCLFRNHVLGQWTENAREWISALHFDRCVKDIDEEQLRNQRCIVGIDTSLNQLAAYVLFFPDSGIVLTRAFHPTDTARKSDEKLDTKLIYWGQEGHLRLTPGDRFDWEDMRVSLEADAKKFRFQEIAFDPYKSEVPASYLDFIGCPVTPVPPTKNFVSDPTRQLERMISKGQITFERNPVVRWNALNAAVSEDAHDRIALDRDKCGGRYDIIAALVIALNRHLATEFDGPSLWDKMIC